MTEYQIPAGHIERPDGSVIALSKLPVRDQLKHELVEKMFGRAVATSTALAAFKGASVSELMAFREMMMNDFEVKIGGNGGNISITSLCGRMKVAYTISKHVEFGPELEAAKALIDECLEDWSQDSRDEIRVIITKVFRVNSKGRLDTSGILGLRSHGFKDPRWLRAMDGIDEAIIRDRQTAYINFYKVDPKTGTETRIPLDLAKVQGD